MTVLSRHSTVSVIIQEMEGRFVDDARQFLVKLAPPLYPYLHNDLDYRFVTASKHKCIKILIYAYGKLYNTRVGPPNWPGGDAAWRAFRATQPVNAHSHLIAMCLGYQLYSLGICL